MPKLVIVDDEGRKTTVPLVRSEVTVGRQEGNTIRLTERNVSRRHARIFRKDGRYHVEDLSRYGTRRSGASVDALAPLEDGDVLLIGSYRLEVSLDGAADPADTPDETPAVAELEAELLTVPLDRTAVRPVPPPSATPARGRLVCLTEPYIGSEFQLTSDDMRIGASDSCELIIVHRSVAAEHARLVRDGSSLRVEALQTGFPVAVDGRYGATAELRAGGELMLGELRFQYVPPGGQLNVLPVAVLEAEAARSAQPRWLYPAIGAAAVLVAVLAWVVLRPAPVPEDTPVDDAGPSVAQAALAEGQAHMAAARWDEAIDAFGRVDAGGPEADLARSLAARATTERQHRERFDAAQAAFDSGDYVASLQALGEIPAGTYYHTRAEDADLERRAVAALVGARLEASQAAQDSGDLGEARRVLEEIQPVAPNDERLLARLAQLDALSGAPPRATPTRREPEAPSPPPPARACRRRRRRGPDARARPPRHPHPLGPSPRRQPRRAARGVTSTRRRRRRRPKRTDRAAQSARPSCDSARLGPACSRTTPRRSVSSRRRAS
ncbi:MAG: FHA domain-containing protein [Myxococcales bacterium]|nr:FHA domain-containing protein [Myxococcales bacterium]